MKRTATALVCAGVLFAVVLAVSACACAAEAAEPDLIPWPKSGEKGSGVFLARIAGEKGSGVFFACVADGSCLPARWGGVIATRGRWRRGPFGRQRGRGSGAETPRPGRADRRRPLAAAGRPGPSLLPRPARAACGEADGALTCAGGAGSVGKEVKGQVGSESIASTGAVSPPGRGPSASSQGLLVACQERESCWSVG